MDSQTVGTAPPPPRSLPVHSVGSDHNKRLRRKCLYTYLKNRYRTWISNVRRTGQVSICNSALSFWAAKEDDFIPAMYSLKYLHPFLASYGSNITVVLYLYRANTIFSSCFFPFYRWLDTILSRTIFYTKLVIHNALKDDLPTKLALAIEKVSQD